MLEERLPRGGQCHLPGIAVQELNPQLAFQHLDSLGDGGLREFEAGCRPAIVTLVRNRDECSQVAQLHGQHMVEAGQRALRTTRGEGPRWSLSSGAGRPARGLSGKRSACRSPSPASCRCCGCGESARGRAAASPDRGGAAGTRRWPGCPAGGRSPVQRGRCCSPSSSSLCSSLRPLNPPAPYRAPRRLRLRSQNPSEHRFLSTSAWLPCLSPSCRLVGLVDRRHEVRTGPSTPSQVTLKEPVNQAFTTPLLDLQ